MNIEWREVGHDSSTIQKVGHDQQNLYVVFKPNNAGYQYFNVPYSIFLRILNKECRRQEDGKPSYGATVDALVKKAGFKYVKFQ